MDQTTLKASVDNYLTGITLVGGSTFTLGYGGSVPEQFYVSGMQVSLAPPEPGPTPASAPAPLALIGLGGLLIGWIGRNKNA